MTHEAIHLGSKVDQAEPVCINSLVKRFDSIPRKSKTLLVGIDGLGGSGKTTLAEAISKVRQDIAIIHFDAFYKPSSERLIADDTREIAGNFDWRRLESQVLKPLAGNATSRFQLYDWETDALAHWLEVTSCDVVIVEGMSSTREELRPYYDYKIWVDCPSTERLRRGVERDGEAMRATWLAEWMPVEDHYLTAHKSHLFVDLIVAGYSASMSRASS